MTIETVVIDVDGSVKVATAETVKDWQEIVGGYIQFLQARPRSSYGGGVDIILNEEGKLLDLPRNDLAAIVFLNLGGNLRLGDWIAGPVAFTGGVDEAGETVSLSAKMIETIKLMAVELRPLVSPVQCRDN